MKTVNEFWPWGTEILVWIDVDGCYSGWVPASTVRYEQRIDEPTRVNPDYFQWTDQYIVYKETAYLDNKVWEMAAQFDSLEEAKAYVNKQNHGWVLDGHTFEVVYEW